LLLWAASVGLAGWGAGQAKAADDGLKEIMGDGLNGYIASGIAPSPGYGYGVSFYSAAWPLVETPLRSFQIGLPSTWIVPDNAGYKGSLCPKGTVARDNWPERGPIYRDVFQTIKGGLGFWGSTQFDSSTPKYRMNGTPDCYNTEISSPGWGFGRPDPLKAEEMGMAQLSNRLLVPPDGFTLKTGARGELLSSAWMALPLTDYKGYFQLQTKAMEGADKCLAGPKADPEAERMGAAFMAKSADSDAQLWKLVPAADGYYRLTNKLREKDGECLEGGPADSTAAAGGAAHTAAFGGKHPHIFGLQWSGPEPTGCFPEYFKQDGDAMTAVAADDVPDETHLKGQTFLPAGRGRAYTSPTNKESAWAKLGPMGDPATVALTDGSKVTYAWYRFVDQPALQQFRFSDAVKDQLQARVELLHKHWNADHDYMPPLTSGALATLDGAMLARPPKGLEVGYVPIVVR
jgi:hypothetical protein